jgi:hypothetical protein
MNHPTGKDGKHVVVVALLQRRKTETSAFRCGDYKTILGNFLLS